MILRTAQPVPATFDALLPRSLAERIDRLDVLSRKVFAGKLPGERRGKRRGRSVEFDDFKPYTPGDDLRHVDWNIYARLDRLVIKLFREDEDMGLLIAVDASASMASGEPTKLEFAHRAAMALAYIGLVKQNRVSVASFGGPGGVRQLTPLRGRANARRVASFLLESLAAGSSPNPAPPRDDLAASFNASVRQIAMSRSGRGVMIVLSDILIPGGVQALGPALNALAAAGSAAFDTYLLHTLSDAELDPAKERDRGLLGDLRLTDAESGRAAEVTVSASLIARYRRSILAYTRDLKHAAAARGIGAFLAPSSTPVETLILDSLRRGGVLR
ncbi:MAG: DUF58 domain-containing protein [Phycisphaeraceae bacterium]|nr:MAG: DUF58 domain-containing protein [Phycisphaeraceae bacterium]